MIGFRVAAPAKADQHKNEKGRPSDKKRAHKPVREFEDMIDLVAVLGGVRRLAKNSLMSARLLIEFVQVFFVDFLMRFERHPAVSPNLEAERANPAHYDRTRRKETKSPQHVLSRFAIFRAVTKGHALACCATSKIDPPTQKAMARQAFNKIA